MSLDTLGVVIGRFQTPFLTVGHRSLLAQALANHKKVLVLIGVSQALGTDKNPLDFDTRKKLFTENRQLNKEDINRLIIEPLPDYMLCDRVWTQRVDSFMERLGFKEATLYGGRDNHLEKHYLGNHDVHIIDSKHACSATELRKASAKEALSDESFRHGIIYHVENRYPIVYPTVDVAIITPAANPDKDGSYYSYVLMGRKGEKFTFIGGFVDPSDEDLEAAALREVQEETGWDLSQLDFSYIFSMKVPDLRYKGTKDGIMTTLFECSIPSDDEELPDLPDMSKIPDKEFQEFKWIPCIKDSIKLISPVHISLFKKYIEDYDDDLEGKA